MEKLIHGAKKRLRAFFQRHDLLYLYLRTLRCALSEGTEEAKKRYDAYLRVNYPLKYWSIMPSRKERQSQREAEFSSNNKISIIVPLYNTPLKYLREMICSVREQTRGEWELCLADGSDATHGAVARYGQRMAQRDRRIRYLKLGKNEGISENSNAALRLAEGNYIGLLDHDDVLHPSALYEVLCAIDKQQADFVYTDEIVFHHKLWDGNDFHCKPDFSPDSLRSYNYICHFTVFRRDLMEKAGGGFRKAMDGSQDHDLFLRLTEQAERIVHVPKILYFWRNHSGSVASDVAEKPYALAAGRKAVSEQLNRLGWEGEVRDSSFPSTYRIRYRIQGNPKVSIIIPNMDHVEDLKKCLDSIRAKTTWQEWEVLVVENNSRKEETFRYYEEAQKRDRRIRVVNWQGEFNFSAICNYGVSYATGEHILLLNNDIEVISPDWLEEMLMFSQREEVGAVGALLYYPDDTVQHAGVIIGTGIAAGHAHRGFCRGENGYLSRLTVVHNVSAVTGACMMIPRRVFDSVSGLDETFRVALNDVDLCLRIRQKGYLIVMTPYAELYHYESKSRGTDTAGENLRRFQEESAHFRETWADFLKKGDPYYNPNLTLLREDFSLKERDEEEKLDALRSLDE